MSVVEAVTGELAGLGRAAESALGATALALARELDEPGNSATSKSMCAKALVDVLREVRALAPPRREQDGVTSLTDRREQRLAGLAAASHPSRS